MLNRNGRILKMSPRIRVRNYHSSDLKSIEEILFEYPSPTGRAWSEDTVKEMISEALKEQPDGVLVATINKEIAGFAVVMHREWFNIAYLDYIQVKTEQMNKGVGHKLIEKCIDWAREKGARIIYTETGENNEEAIRFYQKHDFKITGHIPDYYQKGLDAVFLVKQLG